jgi:hypothetical protein
MSPMDADQRKHLNSKKRQAVLERMNYYRKNGVHHLQSKTDCCQGKCGLASGDRVSTVYDNDVKINAALAALSDFAGMNATDFHIDKFKVKASVPYTNAAHHLVSCDVFTAGDKGRIFDDDELAIMRALKYDVNWGKNVILLPGYSDGVEVQQLIRRLKIKNWKGMPDAQKDPLKAKAYLAARQRVSKAANLHRLPCHWDYHPSYIVYVKQDIKRYKSNLQAEMKEVCETWNPPEALPDKLAGFENDYWKWIVNFGASLAIGKAKSLADITPIKRGKGK